MGLSLEIITISPRKKTAKFRNARKKKKMLIFSRSGVVELLRSIVTSFGVVVSGNSILPKNPMDLFIQIYICLFWII